MRDAVAGVRAENFRTVGPLRTLRQKTLSHLYIVFRVSPGDRSVNALEIEYRFLAPVSALPKTPLKRPQQGSLDPSPELPLIQATIE